MIGCSFSNSTMLPVCSGMRERNILFNRTPSVIASLFMCGGNRSISDLLKRCFKLCVSEIASIPVIRLLVIPLINKVRHGRSWLVSLLESFLVPIVMV